MCLSDDHLITLISGIKAALGSFWIFFSYFGPHFWKCSLGPAGPELPATTPRATESDLGFRKTGQFWSRPANSGPGPTRPVGGLPRPIAYANVQYGCKSCIQSGPLYRTPPFRKPALPDAQLQQGDLPSLYRILTKHRTGRKSIDF